MYIITKVDGTKLSVTDSVNYIKIGESGSLTDATIDDAIGVALNSVAYNLFPNAQIVGTDTVIVSQINSGDLVYTLQQDVLASAEMLLNLQYESDVKDLGGLV